MSETPTTEDFMAAHIEAQRQDLNTMQGIIDRLEREVAELREALTDVRSDLFLQIEAKHGPKAASEYPSIVKANAALKPHAQGGTPNERSSEGTNRDCLKP